MDENSLALVLTIVFVILIGYQVFRRIRRRALNQSNQTKSGKNIGQMAGAADSSGNQGLDDPMDALKAHLEQLKSLTQGQQGTGHQSPVHVVASLSAIYTKLTELDQRIAVFEREAAVYKKRHRDLENP